MEQVTQLPAGNHVSPYLTAYLATALKDKETAFTLLQQACRERATNAPALGVQPEFDDLRQDPRYAGLLRSVGLPVR
jgi:hypothetical protein